jgi:hypothetical protein
MIGITEFYKKVLPSQGVYCIITIEPKEGGTRHYYVESIEELEPKIEELKPLNTSIYVSHSTYKGWKRGKEEAVFSKSLFIDLDVDPEDIEGKKYKSKEEAENALNDFLASANLPEPIRFDSGRGMWAWWAFDRDIPIEEWKLYSEVFKKFCLDSNLKIDPNVTADAARATRTPNCTNWKANPPALAKVLSEEMTTYVFDEFKVFLDEVSPKDLSIEAVLKAAKKGLTQEEREAQGASDWENSFEKLLDLSLKGVGCNQIKYIYENPDSVSYDLWTAGLTVASRCTDSETAIHTISDKAKNYNREATILKAATFGGVHPCTSFENANPEGCQNCPKKGIASNPLIFARKLRETPAIPVVPFQEENPVIFGSVEQTVLTTITLAAGAFTLPPGLLPFFAGPNGGIYRELPPEYDKVTKQLVPSNPILICEQNVWALKKLRNDVDGDCILMRVEYKHNPPREFLFPIKCAYSPDKMMDILASKSIIINRKNVIHFMDYITEWGQYLEKNGRDDVMRTQMGWTDKDHTSFVLGDKEYMRNGEVRSVPVSVPTRVVGPLLHEKGSYENWRTAANKLNLPGMELHAFFMLAGFASPLMAYSSTAGGTICLTGKAGAAKTGALYSALSMWGDPEALHIHTGKQNTTFNGLKSRLNALHNLPLALDEITNMTADDLSNTIHALSSGKAKIRAEGSFNAERAYEASANMIAVMTSNSSIYDKLAAAKADPNGEVARLIEFMITQPEAIKSDETLGRQIFETMKHNFGHAGPMFIKSLFDMESKGDIIRDYDHPDQEYGPTFQKWLKRFIDDIGFDPADRFYHNLITFSMGAGDILNKYEILDNFGVERIYQKIVKEIKNIKENIIQVNTMDYENLLSEFLIKNHAGTLVIKNNKMYEEPKAPLVIRIEDSGIIYIARTIFNTYLVSERKANLMEFKNGIKDTGIELSEKRIRMTAGWKYTGNNEYNVRCYGFKRKEFVDKILGTKGLELEPAA